MTESDNMKFPWKIVKITHTPADQKLEDVKNMLFPPLISKQTVGEDGKVFKYHIDYSTDSNLEAALIDLEEGNNDGPTQKTIRDVVKTLIRVRKKLEAYAIMDHDAQYIIVDTVDNEREIVAGRDN